MTAEQREVFRIALLQILEANKAQFGLPAWAITTHVRKIYGFPKASSAEVGAELTYLRDKSLVEPVNKVVSPENSAWRITAAGRDYLAQAE